MKMIEIRFWNGLVCDGVKVAITRPDGKREKLEFWYGVNASYNREHAAAAQKDYEDAVKYGWSTSGYHQQKPFIGDILADIIETNYANEEDIIYSGYHVFSKKEYTQEEIQKELDDIAEEL